MGLIWVDVRKRLSGYVSLFLSVLRSSFFFLAELKMKQSYNLVWQILDPSFDKHLKC